MDQIAESLATVPLLGLAFERQGIDAPVTTGLRRVLDGETSPRAVARERPIGPPRAAPHSRGIGPGVGSVTSGGSGRQAATRPRLHGAVQGTPRDVYSYSYYRVGNHHDAEDLTEQTFLQAYRHFDRAQRESDGRPLRPWLIRIAHNLAANFYRDRSRRPTTQLDDSSILAEPLGTEQLVEGLEEVKEVLEGVSKLPEDRREALIMRFALGMDNREIARALGAPREPRRCSSTGPSSSWSRASRRTAMSDIERVERLLRSALVPMDPPEALSDRLERSLSELTEVAAAELADWEMSAMRDPRNWARPAAAIVVGSVAAGGLVLVRARQQQKKRHATGLAGAREVDPRRRGRHREAPARLDGVGRRPGAWVALGRRGWPGPPRCPRSRSAGAGSCPRCSPGSG